MSNRYMLIEEADVFGDKSYVLESDVCRAYLTVCDSGKSVSAHIEPKKYGDCLSFVWHPETGSACNDSELSWFSCEDIPRIIRQLEATEREAEMFSDTVREMFPKLNTKI